MTRLLQGIVAKIVMSIVATASLSVALAQEDAPSNIEGVIDENPAQPSNLSPEAVNAAQFTGEAFSDEPSPVVLKLQVLLDRAGYSPGVIDGIMGDNVQKAIGAFEAGAGLPADGILDAETWRVLSSDDQPVLGIYTITPEDLAGPFVPDLPSDYAELAKLERTGYRSPKEMLAERFHMDEDLLAGLNPGVDFTIAGTEILVAAVGSVLSGPAVATIIADKTRAQLFALDASGRIVAAYPATIGSDELPSPSGTHSVRVIARDAAYYYRPDVNFQQGDNTEELTIPPGPNNPIGTTWIDLSEPTYGIHGTPEPALIDKTYSHGCIRLTNWDVEELAGLIDKGVTVEFR